MLAVLFSFLFRLSTLAPMASEPVQCCFVNPSHAGVCVVDPGPGESCASVLAYLNTAGTVGKTYCGNTIIRGGWEQIDCP